MNSSIMLVFSLVLSLFIARICAWNHIKEMETLLSKKDTIFEGCEKCDPKSCPPITQCNMGVVRDQCGCCDVCGLEESQLCNLDSEFIENMARSDIIWHGRCGTDLECRERTDTDASVVGTQSICYCLKDGKVCASDGNTYSICNMRAVSTATNGTITAISSGYCQTAPTVNLIAPTQTISENFNVTLICEARGYPIPTISWFFNKSGQRANKHHMPGSVKDVTVSICGGPEDNQIISYLQIVNFNLSYEGEYECMAENNNGIQAQIASLIRSSAA